LRLYKTGEDLLVITNGFNKGERKKMRLNSGGKWRAKGGKRDKKKKFQNKFKMGNKLLPDQNPYRRKVERD